MHARVELKFDVEAHTVKEAGNLSEFGAYSLRNSSSGSSVQELQDIQELCSANKRVSREDRSQRKVGKLGHSCAIPLAHQLSVKLDTLDLLSTSERVSVIILTPGRSPATSTPSSSPPAPLPAPPRTCQSLGPIYPPDLIFSCS